MSDYPTLDPNKTFGQPIMRTPFVGRSSKSITQELEHKRDMLKWMSKSGGSIKGNITKKKKKIGEEEEEVAANHPLWYSKEYNLVWKLRPELKMLEIELGGLPRRIRDAKVEIEKLEEELEEAEERERKAAERRETAKVSRLTTLSMTPP